MIFSKILRKARNYAKIEGTSPLSRPKNNIQTAGMALWARRKIIENQKITNALRC